MSWQPVFTSFSFAISNYQITCGLDEKDLKITVSSPQPNQDRHLFSLSKYAVSNSKTIDLWISQFSSTGEKINPSQQSQSITHLLEEYSIKEKAMLQKIQELQIQFQSLCQKLQTQESNQNHLKRNNTKNKMYQPPTPHIYNNQPVNLNEGNEDFQNAKLQMLNCVLQQKLFEKEGQIISIQKKLMERDDLVRELADKLMVANIQKQDIFNQYEKILQNTVFSKLEEDKKQASTLIIDETVNDIPSEQKEEEGPKEQPNSETKKIEIQEEIFIDRSEPKE